MIRNFTPLLFLVTAGLCAQPTIQQVSLNVGDALVLDVVFPITAAGPGSANAVWDFSTSAFSGVEFPYTAQAVASTPYAAQFPNATIALFTDQSYEFSGYFYFNFNGGFTELGNVFIDNFDVQQNIPSDPLTFYTTPLSASSSGSDTYTSLSETVYGDVQTSGTHTWTVDGYGTLKMPNTTYTDVLRIHAVQNEERTIIWDGVPMFTSVVLREEWRWVKAGIPLPLLVFSMDTEDGETEVSVQTALISLNGPTSVLEEQGVLAQLFPNPAQRNLQVEMPAYGTVSLRVFDALGRVLMVDNTTAAGQLSHTLDVEHLLPGFYTLELIGTDGRSTVRFIKQ
ncbi:MAG: T9SS type A sorting domain-containing protein [Flavobacteriales bacterium]